MKNDGQMNKALWLFWSRIFLQIPDTRGLWNTGRMICWELRRAMLVNGVSQHPLMGRLRGDFYLCQKGCPCATVSRKQLAGLGIKQASGIPYRELMAVKVTGECPRWGTTSDSMAPWFGAHRRGPLKGKSTRLPVRGELPARWSFCLLLEAACLLYSSSLGLHWAPVIWGLI